jgi:hypothetical protein
MNTLKKQSTISIKVLLSLVLCFTMLQTVFVSEANAASKDGKTGMYGGVQYIAHKDIPAYMKDAKKQIETQIKLGSKLTTVKYANLPSVILNKLGSSLTLAKSFLRTGYYATYYYVKWKDKGKGIKIYKNGKIESQ